MILAILQARMSSSRLPGKVSKNILGKPMLVRQIERLSKSKLIDKIIVATSIEASDNELETFCKDNNIECFRGNLNNVLDRYYQCAKQFNPQHIIRLTGDCPVTDPQIIDKIIELHLEENNDYTSNTIIRTFPKGLDAEIFKYSSLEKAYNEAKTDFEKEHVTVYFYQHPELFKLGCFKNDIDLSNLRLTVDYPEDFELITKIYESLYTNKPNFTLNDIIELLNQNQTLKLINSQYPS